MTAAQTEILSDQSGYRKTAGERLRRAREIKGLSQKDVANALNLMVSHVRAIESNRYNAQAEGEHFGGYLRSYARLVELDPQQIIDLYSAQSDDGNADTVVLAETIKPSPRQQSRLKPGIVIGALAAACLVVVVWGVSQFGGFGDDSERPEATASEQETVTAQQEEAVATSEPSSAPAVTEDKPAAAQPESERAVVPNTDTPSASRERPVDVKEVAASASPAAAINKSQTEARDVSSGAVVRNGGGDAQANVSDRAAPTGKSPGNAARERRQRVAAQTAADRSTNASLSNIGIQQRATRTNRQSSRGVDREADRRVQSEAATSDSGQVAVSGSDQLVLEFSTDCWVEIYDANGAALRLGVERAGEQLRLRGEAPFDVLVGFSRGVTMTLNGKPVPIRQHQFSDSTQLVVGGPDDYFGTQQTFDDDDVVASGKSSSDELSYVTEDEIAERFDEGRVIRERSIESGEVNSQSERNDRQSGEAGSSQQLAADAKRVNVPARYSRPFAAPAPSTANELENAARQSNSEKDEDGSRNAYSSSSDQRSGTTSSGEKQDQLEFTFTAECWVEVYDVEKRPLVMDTKYAGETLELSGQGPFEVRVGNSRAVSLKVNGQKIEIKRDRYIGSTEFFVGSR